MSILIKGMEMPKDCDSCRCICSRWNGDETIWRCGLLVGEDYETTDRDELYKDCPLAEIPKHGRLIDADALKEHLDYVCVGGGKWGDAEKAFINAFKDFVDGEITIQLELPSAESEIIRCKDCAKREYCRTSTAWAVAPSDNWYCADAERRTE